MKEKEEIQQEPLSTDDRATEIQERKRERGRGGYFVPAFILIFLGIVFLANNLGLIPWYVWGELWRFWPVFLILLGFQFLLGRSLIARIIMGLLTIAIILGLLFYALAYAGLLTGDHFAPINRFVPRASVTQQQDHMVVGSDTVASVSSRLLRIDSGLGKIILAENDSDDYFTLDASYPNSFTKPTIDTDVNNDVLTINVDVQEEGGFRGMPHMGSGMNYQASIGRPTVPTDLQVQVGAGSAEGTFNELILNDLAISVGMGSAEFSLNSQAIPKENTTLDVGMGSIDLEIPEDVGLKVSYSVGLGSVNIDGENFRGDGSYTSDNFDKATKKLTLSTRVGTGSISISRH